MNCFGTHTESTESLIPNEDNVSEVIDLSNVDIKEEDEDQTGEDEVGEEMEEEEESEKKAMERPDFLLKLLEHCINTILLEEMTLVGRKMNAFRQALADGVLKFAQREEAENSTAKMDRFVDSFRAAWKDWKEKEDQESMVNVFMQEMNNELWYPER